MSSVYHACPGGGSRGTRAAPRLPSWARPEGTLGGGEKQQKVCGGEYLVSICSVPGIESAFGRCLLPLSNRERSVLSSRDDRTEAQNSGNVAKASSRA